MKHKNLDNFKYNFLFVSMIHKAIANKILILLTNILNQLRPLKVTLCEKESNKFRRLRDSSSVFCSLVCLCSSTSLAWSARTTIASEKVSAPFSWARCTDLCCPSSLHSSRFCHSDFIWHKITNRLLKYLTTKET